MAENTVTLKIKIDDESLETIHNYLARMEKMLKYMAHKQMMQTSIDSSIIDRLDVK